jgi:hypothetical protein
MQAVTVLFFNDGPGPACFEYSYIPSGERRSIELLNGVHAATRVDSLSAPETYSLVQVYSVQTEGLGACWDDFPALPAPKSALTTVIFQIRCVGGEVVGSVYYEDGTKHSGTAPLLPISIPCPSGL